LDIEDLLNRFRLGASLFGLRPAVSRDYDPTRRATTPHVAFGCDPTGRSVFLIKFDGIQMRFQARQRWVVLEF